MSYMDAIGCKMEQRMDKSVSREFQDAMRGMLADLPCPQSYARMLETAYPPAAQALRNAYLGSQQPYAGVLRVANDQYAPILRKLGLIGFISSHDTGLAVGNFGMQVRRALMGDGDDG